MEKGPNIETPNFINQNKKAFGTATSATKDDCQYETLGKHEKSPFNQNLIDFVFQNLKIPKPLHFLCSDLMVGDLNLIVREKINVVSLSSNSRRRCLNFARDI